MTVRAIPRVIASPRLKRLQWTVILLLLLAATINYVDRSTLAIGNPQIRADLHLSLTQMGILLSAFSWSYALTQLAAGGLVDRVGPQILLSAGLALWSLAQIVGGLVTSLGQFIWARIALGVGESPMFPTGARVSTNWFNVRERGLPMGLVNSGSTLGPAISAPLLTGIMLAIGWRGMFIAMGIAGLIVAVIWYLVYRQPRAAGISEEELRYLSEGDVASTKAVTLSQWGRLFGRPQTWGMVIGFFGVVYLIWIYNTWLPGYFEIERHQSITKAGLLTSIPFVFGFIGSIFGGIWSDALARRGMAPVASRKATVVFGLFGMAIFSVLAAVAPNTTAAVILFSVANFCGNISSSTAWTLATAVAPPTYVASLGSIQNFGGYLGASFAPAVTGRLADVTHSFIPGLVIGAIIAVISALSYLLIVHHPIEAADLGERGEQPAMT